MCRDGNCFLRATARHVASSHTHVPFCLQKNSRNVGLYLARSNANLSKGFTLSRVLLYFHPEGDPLSFGQIVYTYLTWLAWMHLLHASNFEAGVCTHEALNSVANFIWIE